MGVKDERSELTPDYLVGTCLALLVCLVSKHAFLFDSGATYFIQVKVPTLGVLGGRIGVPLRLNPVSLARVPKYAAFGSL